MSAMQYMDDMLAHIENIISQSSQTASTHYENLINSLNQYQDIIQSNRSELHPVEDDDLEDVPLTEESEGDGIDVI